MNNKKLRDALRAYCELACNLLQPVKGQIRPLAFSHLVAITDEDQIAQRWKPELFWQIWVEPIFDQLENSPPAREIETALYGKRESTDRIDGGAPRLRRSVLFSLLKRQQIVEFQGDVFEELYGEVESYLDSETYRVRHVAPLVGFESAGGRIEIEPHLVIRKLENSEREELLTRYGFSAASRLSDVRFAIEITHPKKKPNWNPGSRDRSERIARETLDDLCTVMRLFKAGRVGYTDVMTSIVGWSPSGGRHSSHSLQPPIWNWGENYFLSADEVDSLRQYWTLFKKVRKDRARSGRRCDPLDLALRRFNSAYERSDEDDRLMDLIFAMEPLLLAGSQAELRYHFSLRGAYILASDADGRERTYSELSAGYKCRNDLAHGNAAKATITVGSEELSVSALNLRLGRHARDLIGYLTRVDITKAHLEDRVDRAIARGVAPSTLIQN